MSVRGERVLVTGGAGFLGQALGERLLREGFDVTLLDVEPPADRPGVRGAGFVLADVRDLRAVRDASARMDLVFHCAAIQPVSRADREGFWGVNVGGTRNVLEAALRAGARRAIYLSSSAPYGVPERVPIDETTPFRPVCDYGRSKIAAEGVCRVFRGLGLDVVVLRPRVLIGPGRLGIWQILFDWIADGRRVFLIGDGGNRFQALSIEDMVDACVSCAVSAGAGNEDLNLGASSFGTMGGDLRSLIDHAGTGSTMIRIPAAPVKAALRGLDAASLSPLTAWHYLTFDADFFFDTSRARSVLGWEPRIGNREMLASAYDWYVGHRDLVDRAYGTTHRRSARQRIFRLLRAIS